jgi:hypothetical protein
MRTSIRRLTRLTNAFSKKWEHLKAMLAVYFAYYNFCRIHSSIRCTPAMESGITSHVWSLRDLLAARGHNPMMLLTNESGEKAIQCDLFEETVRFTPNHLITLTHQDGTANYYVIGEAVRRENDWIVPLQIVAEADEAEARRTGTIGYFVEGGDGALQ